jgi:hypothetical protein
MARSDWQQAAERLLRERGALHIEHPGGILLEHTLRVSGLLEDWGADEDLQAAGLCHACYGTDGFPLAILDLSERESLAHIIGMMGEEIVYLYASCERKTTYPRLSGAGTLLFSDRFTRATRYISHDQTRAWLELTAANELDLVLTNPKAGATWAPGFYGLLRNWRCWLSGPALEAWERALAGLA